MANPAPGKSAKRAPTSTPQGPRDLEVLETTHHLERVGVEVSTGGDPDLRSDRWTIRTIGERLAVAGDPLAPLIGKQQRLPDLS